MEPEPHRSVTPSKKPGRQTSRRQALPRRFTKGPLDTDVEDPLTSEPGPTTQEAQAIVQDVVPIEKDLPPSPTVAAPPSKPVISVNECPAKDFSYLLKPDNFLPLNDLDVPPPFRQELTKQASDTSLPDLISSGHFRLAAVLSAALLKTETKPTEHVRILFLLYTRLACLQLLNLESQAAHEAKCLQDLSAPFYRDRGMHLVPWELRVLAVRLHAIGFGDWRRGVMAYYELARECRLEVSRVSAEEKLLWKERLQDLGLRIASALVEIGDFDGAVRHLQSLSSETSNKGLMRTLIALTLLRCGDIDTAKTLCGMSDIADTSSTNSVKILTALCTMAEGDFEASIPLWDEIRKSKKQEDVTIATQNLSLCLVYTGQIVKARELLDILVEDQGNIRSITYNLSTIYELCSDKSKEMKLRLAEKVAAQPATSLGWDKSNADFKL